MRPLRPCPEARKRGGYLLPQARNPLSLLQESCPPRLMATSETSGGRSASSSPTVFPAICVPFPAGTLKMWCSSSLLSIFPSGRPSDDRGVIPRKVWARMRERRGSTSSSERPKRASARANRRRAPSYSMEITSSAPAEERTGMSPGDPARATMGSPGASLRALLTMISACFAGRIVTKRMAARPMPAWVNIPSFLHPL